MSETNEYTPTDEEVRERYSTDDDGKEYWSSAMDRVEFDRWLSAHDARIRAEAQAEQREADAAIAEKCDPVEVALSGAAYVAAAIRGGKS